MQLSMVIKIMRLMVMSFAFIQSAKNYVPLNLCAACLFVFRFLELCEAPRTSRSHACHMYDMRCKTT